MKKKLLILGAGGHAKVLLDILFLRGLKVYGWITPDYEPGKMVAGLPVLGNDEVVYGFSPDETELVNGLGSTGALGRRKNIFEKFKGDGYSFLSLIHPAAIIAKDIEICEGAQIMAGTVLQPGTRIGRNTIVNTKASVDHDCVIGDHVHIAPGVTISGGVQIADCVHVGTGASIIQGILVGSNSIVGAGSLVIRNIKDQQMVLGVPAKVVKTMKDWKRALVKADFSIRQTIQVIDSEALKIAIVVGQEEVLLGTVTDGDIRRGIIQGISLEASVEKIMNKTPICVSEDESRDRILSLMKEKSIMQVPVLDKLNRVIRVELLENLILK
jgi:UDP-perosamine 4-acetyltransferase